MKIHRIIIVTLVSIFISLKTFSQINEFPWNGLVLNLDAARFPSDAPDFLTIQEWGDYSNYGNDGILFNKSQIKNVISGITESIHFNGSSDFISIKNSPSLNPTSGITIISWYKLNDLVSNQNILSKGYNSIQIPYVQYSLKMSEISPYNTPQFNLSLNGKLSTLNGSTKLSTNTWYMVVCTYDKKTMKLFVNNIQDPKVIYQTNEISTYPTNLEIGRWPTGQSQYLKGDISKVFIYDRSLTNKEIEDIWNSSKSKFGYQENFNSNISLIADSEIMDQAHTNNQLIQNQTQVESENDRLAKNQKANQLLQSPLKGNSKIKLEGDKIYEGDYTYYKTNDQIDSSTIALNGNGKLYENGAIVYEGGFQNNLFEGPGKAFYESGEIKTIGEYKKGKLNGFGKFYHWEGRLFYEGNFVEDKYSGYGKYYGENADKLEYEGEFLFGSYSGKGKYYQNGELVFDGEFKNGRIVEQVSSYKSENSNSSSQYSTNQNNTLTASQNRSTFFDKIYNGLTDAEKKYLNQILDMESDPHRKVGVFCATMYSKCNKCGKQFMYHKYLESKIQMVKNMTTINSDPDLSNYAETMTSLAYALFGGTKALKGETKNSSITRLTSDLKRDLKLIKSGSYYFCTGVAPNYCNDCKRSYPYLR